MSSLGLYENDYIIISSSLAIINTLSIDLKISIFIISISEEHRQKSYPLFA